MATHAEQLLDLVAMSGELPNTLLSRLDGGASYQKKLITSLKQDGMISAYSRDGMKGYRLSAAAKRLLLNAAPERYSFFLSGANDTNMLRYEASRRQRLHQMAEVLVNLSHAGAFLGRDEKLPIFELPILPPKADEMFYPAFYISREIKRLGLDLIKARGFRMTGVY